MTENTCNTEIKKPVTISEISNFLSLAMKKVLSLNASSFGKFTSDRLPDDYIYNKWQGKEKDFADVYLSLDQTHQHLFVEYVIGKHDDVYYFAFLLYRFFLFCWNWDSPSFTENPFAGKYKDYLRVKATGKKNPQGISSKQVQALFNKLDENGRQYLTWCVFGEPRIDVNKN